MKAVPATATLLTLMVHPSAVCFALGGASRVAASIVLIPAKSIPYGYLGFRPNPPDGVLGGFMECFRAASRKD